MTPSKAFWLLVCLLPQAVHAEERLGRLFLTPAERSNLDYVRQNSKPPDRINLQQADVVEEDHAVASPPPVSSVTVQGYVRRSDGKGTVWVNRRPLGETSTQGDIRIGKLNTADGKVRLKLSGADKEVALKAGQTYDPATGTVIDPAKNPLLPPVAPAPATPPTKAPQPAPVAPQPGKP